MDTPLVKAQLSLVSVPVVGRGVVSFQITILKVLAGQPDGRASHPDVTKSVAILMSSGGDWSSRMKRLAGRAPGLSIFSSNYVVRDEGGWQITGAGLAFLTSIEKPAAESAVVGPEILQPVTPSAADRPVNIIPMEEYRARRRRRAAA